MILVLNLYLSKGFQFHESVKANVQLLCKFIPLQRIHSTFEFDIIVQLLCKFIPLQRVK